MNGLKTVAAGSMLVGGVVGAVLYATTTIAASGATTAASPSPTTPATAAGRFVSNETAAHEATESAARERRPAADRPLAVGPGIGPSAPRRAGESRPSAQFPLPSGGVGQEQSSGGVGQEQSPLRATAV